MKKKGQVTIFIIIALIILVFGIGIYFFYPNIVEKTSNPEIGQVNNFVLSCLEKTAEDVIFTIGQGGGHYYPPKKSTSGRVAYYIYGEKNYIPSKEQIEEEISDAISENLFICIKGFKDFKDLEIGEEELKTKSFIENNKISIQLNYPLSIKKGESVSLINNFETSIDSNLGKVFFEIEKIVYEQEKSKGVCLSCLMDFSKDKNYNVNMFTEINDSVSFVFQPKEKSDKRYLKWIYANKY